MLVNMERMARVEIRCPVALERYDSSNDYWRRTGKTAPSGNTMDLGF